MRTSLTALAPNKPIRHLLNHNIASSSTAPARFPAFTPHAAEEATYRPWHPTSPFPQYPSPAEAHRTEDQPTHWLMRQTRSAIGLPAKKQKILESLGFRRRFHWTLHRFSPSTAGNILAVKELVEVKTCTEKYGLEWLARTKRLSEGSGLAVSGRVYGGSKRASQWCVHRDNGQPSSCQILLIPCSAPHVCITHKLT